MPDWTLETTAAPQPSDIDVLERGLHDFNLAQLGPEVIYNYARLAAYARDPSGVIIGGIHGELVWEWLYIRTLWVDEAWRGHGIGSNLLTAIEREAVARGIHQAHLETTDFQAIGFYRRHGYTIFGQIEGKPAGHTWYFIQKCLV
jgi:ribosomal protein S18 acetylase RimI-like enzyme